ncbi:unnamed protein product [Alopecurus aequalis]
MDNSSVWRQAQQQAGGGGGAGATAAPCRPTGARWTPTPEQVKILKELYYGCGIRSPNADQIQRIAARLRQFGRIEGKNVFYWFQNHKARERHKKRLGATIDISSSAEAAHLGVVLSPSPGSGAAASSGGFYGSCNARGGSAMQMEGSTTTTCWGDSTWTAGAAAPTSSGSFFGAGSDGRVWAAPMNGSTTTTCWGDNAAGIGATGGSFVQLQDYMGVTRSTEAGNHGPAPAQTRWPACFSFSADQTPPMTTREPETLPLFPTGGQGNYLQQQSSSNFQWCGAATTTTATTNTMTFQQQKHHQLQQEQQQYSFYSNQQLMMVPRQDDTSLELTLSHPAGRM